VAPVPERRRCLVLERRAPGVASGGPCLQRHPPIAKPPARRARGPHVVALGGGKGGVGKTFLAANLAAELARLGLRVAAVDTDLEGANLHTWLGVPRPAASLADFVAGRESDVAKLLVETPVVNLALVAATQGHLTSAHPEGARRAELLQGLRRLDRDVVVIDCGAGVHPAVIDYFLLGDDGILVVHPEPTSLENAYAFLRAAFYRRMHLAMLSHSVQDRIAECMDQRNERGIRTPQDLLREVQAMDSADARRFVETMRAMRPRVIVNEVASAEDVKLGFAVKSVCRSYFGLEAEYAGYVNRDDAVRRSLQKRRPLVDLEPRSDAAVYLRRIAGKLAEGIGAEPGPAARTRAGSQR
jgi:flagellar biosynthesis protein FlhG